MAATPAGAVAEDITDEEARQSSLSRAITLFFAVAVFVFQLFDLSIDTKMDKIRLGFLARLIMSWYFVIDWR